MANHPQERQAEINLEDLLRLKRSERPSDQFWNEFDQELHQRMLQTLVKKDPWYLQLMRGFSGRILQNTALAAAAVVIGVVLVRPAFQPMASSTGAIAMDSAAVVPSGNTAMAGLMYGSDLDAVASELSMTDYYADAMSVGTNSDDVNFIRDFEMESMQVASYDASVYMTESAQARVSFASAGVASLVY